MQEAKATIWRKIGYFYGLTMLSGVFIALSLVTRHILWIRSAPRSMSSPYNARSKKGVASAESRPAAVYFIASAGCAI
jgi:hypothetical protein